MDDHTKDGLLALTVFIVGIVLIVHAPPRLHTTIAITMLFVCWTFASGIYRR